MLGLVKKDLLMTKGNIKTFLIIIVVFALVAMNGNGNFSFIPAFISVMIMMNTFSYDEYNKTNAYISTFPNGKKNIVKSKYITTLIVLMTSLILTILISVIVGIYKNNLDLEEILQTSLGVSVGVIFLETLLYPAIFKFGVEKSRIGIFVFVFAIVGIVSIIAKCNLMLKIPANISQFFENYSMIILPIIMIVILLISYKVSVHIFMKKDN